MIDLGVGLEEGGIFVSRRFTHFKWLVIKSKLPLLLLLLLLLNGQTLRLWERQWKRERKKDTDDSNYNNIHYNLYNRKVTGRKQIIEEDKLIESHSY